MTRALTILATAALALPVGHHIDDALGTGVRKLGTTGALAAPVAATDESNAGAQVGLLYRGAVEVGADGNGVRAARFATTLAGRDVRYVLLIENGCAGTDPARQCPAPVRELTVTLNDDVVFQNDDAFSKARREIALNPVDTNDNSLLLAAKGAPASGARVRILALRQPDKPKPKPPVLGLLSGSVEVGADGNGVRAARFATSLAGRDVRYVLLIENGCAGTDPARRCPAPVRELTVTLNDDVVFQNDDAFSKARREIALNPVDTNDNSLLLAAKGAPGPEPASASSPS